MTVENFSIQSCLKQNDIEIDQRRIDLYNDSNYGIVLCFLEKYRSLLDLPNYPLQLFEDHLLHYQGQNPPRLIDFHITLLKRLSLAKNAQRDKFDSIIIKFASRFDINDSEHLLTNGYLQSDIHVKIRILKNLLESQFDLNQTFRHILSDQSAREIKSLPFGRDRFGVSYWFFMDKNCFVRLFREDVDIDRTWTIVAKNQDELEKFIILLITDWTVRKKFSDWTIDYEPFSSLSSSSEFEQCYSPILLNVEEKEIETSEIPIKRKRGRPKRLTDNKIDLPVKQEEEDIVHISNDKKTSDLSVERKRGRPRGSGKVSIKQEEVQIVTCSNNRKHHSDQEQREDDETSVDDISLAIRRSARTRKASIIEPACKTKSQLFNRKKKRKVSNSRYRRRKSTTSSDEHFDNLTEDEFNSDDYLSDPSPLDTDDHFFELDDEDNPPIDEQIRSAKTAQTSTMITACYVCSKSDRPEVLLLCDDCNDAYHLECLRPILLSVPDGDWFCPLCEHKQLSNCLIEKFKELIINYHQNEMKQSSKRSFERKIRRKEYSSDESMTASESEPENSNLSSSSYMDENQNNISQRGRHRRTRFDMKKILDNHDDYNYYSDSNDDQQITDFHLQLPEKITRLLHRRDRNTEQQIKTLPTRLDHTSLDSNDPSELNEKLGSPIVYVTSDGHSRQMKSVITNSKQTLQIVRRWNDVQRRSRLKAINMKLSNKTMISDCTDENSNLCLDDTSSLHSNSEIKDHDNTISHCKISLVQPTTFIPLDTYSSRNMVQKVDANFDQLTRDIQFAVNEAHSLPTMTKISDQQHVKRIQKKFFSPFITKSQLPSLLPDVDNIFKSKDCSTSNIILTSSSSSSLLHATDDSTLQMTNT